MGFQTFNCGKKMKARNKQFTDIAIIGGGLAGLCFAIQAVNKGYSVALFEKESYPHQKVCGEYISMESWSFLKHLGIPLSTMQLPLISRLEVSSVNGNVFKHALPLGGFGISRFTLDALLANVAIQKGVQLFTTTKITDVSYHEEATNKGSFKLKVQAASPTTIPQFYWEALMAVGSFGKRSNLDVQWKRPFTQQKPNKLNNYVGIKYHIQLPHKEDTIALHNFKNGYCGISKIEDNKSCLCYLTTAKNLKDYNGSIKRMEESILYKNPFLAQIFKEATFLYTQPIAISQISFQQKQTIENHVLMIGDAAGSITPLCGNGMSMAMHASKIAFKEVDLFLEHHISRSQMEHNYQQGWKQAFSTRLAVGRSIQSMFGDVFTSNVLVNTMKTFPFLASPLIKATHGKPF